MQYFGVGVFLIIFQHASTDTQNVPAFKVTNDYELKMPKPTNNNCVGNDYRAVAEYDLDDVCFHLYTLYLISEQIPQTQDVSILQSTSANFWSQLVRTQTVLRLVNNIKTSDLDHRCNCFSGDASAISTCAQNKINNRTTAPKEVASPCPPCYTDGCVKCISKSSAYVIPLSCEWIFKRIIAAYSTLGLIHHYLDAGFPLQTSCQHKYLIVKKCSAEENFTDKAEAGTKLSNINTELTSLQTKLNGTKQKIVVVLNGMTQILGIITGPSTGVTDCNSYFLTPTITDFNSKIVTWEADPFNDTEYGLVLQSYGQIASHIGGNLNTLQPNEKICYKMGISDALTKLNAFSTKVDNDLTVISTTLSRISTSTLSETETVTIDYCTTYT